MATEEITKPKTREEVEAWGHEVLAMIKYPGFKLSMIQNLGPGWVISNEHISLFPSLKQGKYYALIRPSHHSYYGNSQFYVDPNTAIASAALQLQTHFHIEGAKWMRVAASIGMDVKGGLDNLMKVYESQVVQLDKE